jgi:FixJ family two-component response regulator
MPRAPFPCVVYVVEADRSVREAMSRLIASTGLTCRPFESIESFLRETPDAAGACALLDLADASLREAHMRSRVQAVARVLPLIAITADDDVVTRHRARELGARACFRKPVDASALVDSILWLTQAQGRHEPS